MQIFSPQKIELSKEKKSLRTDDRIATALPLTIVFIFLFFAVVLGQNFLSSKTSIPNTISVAFELSEQQDEIQDSNLFDELTQVTQQKIETLVTQYLSNQLSVEEVLDRVNSDTSITAPILTAALIEKLVKQKKYIKILPLFSYLNPQQIEALGMSFNYAVALTKNSKVDDAIIEYQQLLKREPRHQAALVNLGLLLLKKNRPKQAFQIFSKGLSFASGVHKAKIYAGLGDSQIALKRPQDAVLSFHKSIEYRPTSSLTWKKLARAQGELKRPVAVVSLSYQKALSLQPSNSRLTSEYANYLFSKMRFKQTTILLRKQLRQSKTSISERLMLVVSYLEQQRNAKAKKQLSYLNKYTSRRKQKVLVDSFAGYLRGELENSLLGFKSYLKKNRDNDLAYYMIGRSYMLQNKPKNAAVYFRKILMDSQFYNTAQYRLGMSTLSLKDPEQAQSIFSQLFSRLPQNVDIAFQVAKLAYRKKNSSIAYSAISKTILAYPDRKDFRLLEAKIKWRMGERDSVFKMLNKILDQHPNYKPAIYRLADYYSKQQQFDHAIRQFSRLLKINEDYSDVQFRIAVLMFNQSQSNDTIVNLITNYLQRRSDDVKARLFYAKLLCKSAQKSECERQLALVKKFEPHNKEAENLRVLYFESRK